MYLKTSLNAASYSLYEKNYIGLIEPKFYDALCSRVCMYMCTYVHVYVCACMYVYISKFAHMYV